MKKPDLSKVNGIDIFISNHFRRKRRRQKIINLGIIFPFMIILFFSGSSMSPKKFLEDFKLPISIQDAYCLSLIPKEYQNFVYQGCLSRGIPLTYYYRMIKIESSWYYKAVGENYRNGVVVSYDRGLGQINSKCQDELVRLFFRPEFPGEKFNVFNWRHNLQVSMNYIQDLYKTMGTWPRAFAAYNCGATAVKRGKIPEITKKYVSRIIY